MSESRPARSSPADGATLDRAANLLRTGGVVAFPTETVYGLGANAGDEVAVRRVFAIKARPLGHPVIVHLADADALGEWAREIPPDARALAERFWPGPLTLVLRRTARASDLVTGGQDTVAIRVPSDPIAHEILQRAGIGVIAPSANRFGGPSATRAEHVIADFGDGVDLVVNGGATTIGIESTIVNLTGATPQILRPGGVTREEIETALRKPVPAGDDDAVRVPGSLPSHYAPRAKVEVFENFGEALERVRTFQERGIHAEFLAPKGSVELLARELYERLREADRHGAQVIVIVAPPEGGLGSAIRDRLRRAAGPRT